jgi:hypothetical protein
MPPGRLGGHGLQAGAVAEGCEDRQVFNHATRARLQRATEWQRGARIDRCSILCGGFIL